MYEDKYNALLIPVLLISGGERNPRKQRNGPARLLLGGAAGSKKNTFFIHEYTFCVLHQVEVYKVINTILHEGQE